MKVLSLFRIVAALGLFWLPAGCSSALFSRGPNVSQYSSAGKTFTRTDVIRELGSPASSTFLRPSRSVAALVAQGHPALQGGISDRTARVAIIDEYVLRGHVMDSGAAKDASVTGGLALLTLSASEVVFLPLAIADAIETAKDVHRLSMVYAPGGRLVAHRLTDAK